MATQTTLVLLKPDTLQRGLAGQILSRFEAKGLTIVGLRLVRADADQARRQYAEHAGKHFYEPLMAFVTSSPLVAVALAGEEAIAVVRRLIGATNGREAAAGTIRGDLGLSGRLNLVHASDGPEAAARELALWFPDGTCGWERHGLEWRMESDPTAP